MTSYTFFRCLERLLNNWEPLSHFFQEEKKSAEAKKKSNSEVSYSMKKLEGIANFLKSPTNHLFCMFLSYTVKVFNKVLVDLQAEEPMIHILRASLRALLRDLYSRFLEPVAVFNIPVETVTP